eukprot:535935-Prymnesium_polylepis.1
MVRPNCTATTATTDTTLLLPKRVHNTRVPLPAARRPRPAHTRTAPRPVAAPDDRPPARPGARAGRTGALTRPAPRGRRADTRTS